MLTMFEWSKSWEEAWQEAKSCRVWYLVGNPKVRGSLASVAVVLTSELGKAT